MSNQSVKAGGAATTRRVLHATAEEFRSPSYRWDKGLVVQRIADRAGVSEDTIYKHFTTKDELISEFLVFLLSAETAGTEEDAAWTVERLAQEREQLSLDSSDPRDLFDALIMTALDTTIGDSMFTAQVFLWTQMEGEARVQGVLSEYYAKWDSAISDGLRRQIEAARNYGGRQRLGFEADEMAVVLSALIEGLALRARVDPTKARPDLARRAVRALLAEWITFADEDRHYGEGGEYTTRRDAWRAAQGQT